MSRSGWMLGMLAGAAIVASLAASGAGDGGGADAPRVVVHLNFADAARQGAGLRNVANVLKEAPDAEIEVVCHGDGIGLVVADRTGHAGQVEALRAEGVRFVACRNTMRERSIRAEDLLPGVGTVPSGAVEVIRTQQVEGFAYFKP